MAPRLVRFYERGAKRAACQSSIVKSLPASERLASPSACSSVAPETSQNNVSARELLALTFSYATKRMSSGRIFDYSEKKAALAVESGSCPTGEQDATVCLLSIPYLRSMRVRLQGNAPSTFPNQARDSECAGQAGAAARLTARQITNAPRTRMLGGRGATRLLPPRGLIFSGP